MSKPNPSPNAFPKLSERFSARFPLKGKWMVPSFALWIWKRDATFYKIKYDHLRPVLCYVPIFWSNYNLDLRSYVQLLALFYIVPTESTTFNDLAERNDLKLRLWLFFSRFLFPPKKEGRRKGEWIAKIVFLSHAFLLDHFQYSLYPN